MQTNQTPEELAEEILCLSANGMDWTEELMRLRDMAASGAKDAEEATLLRVIQRLNQNPYSLTKSECIDEVNAMRDAATKRGGA